VSIQNGAEHALGVRRFGWVERLTEGLAPVELDDQPLALRVALALDGRRLGGSRCGAGGDGDDQVLHPS
jgi:hypothetical protein